jgi:hypothetical protein
VNQIHSHALKVKEVDWKQRACLWNGLSYEYLEIFIFPCPVHYLLMFVLSILLNKFIYRCRADYCVVVGEVLLEVVEQL